MFLHDGFKLSLTHNWSNAKLTIFLASLMKLIEFFPQFVFRYLNRKIFQLHEEKLNNSIIFMARFVFPFYPSPFASTQY
jgi:hypothetical protein